MQDTNCFVGREDGPALPEQTNTAKSPGDMHEAGVVHGRKNLGSGLLNGLDLVGEHGKGGIGILHGKGPTKATALRLPRQVHQLEASCGSKKLLWRRANIDTANGMAGCVQRHPAWEGPADTLLTHLLDQKLTHFKGYGSQSANLGLHPDIPNFPGEDRVLFPNHGNAGGRWSYDHIRFPEATQPPLHELAGFFPKAGVEMDLSATGLLRGELYLVPQAFQNPHQSLSGLGKKGVVEAGDEEGYSHGLGSLHIRRILILRAPGGNFPLPDRILGSRHLIGFDGRHRTGAPTACLIPNRPLPLHPGPK